MSGGPGEEAEQDGHGGRRASDDENGGALRELEAQLQEAEEAKRTLERRLKDLEKEHERKLAAVQTRYDALLEEAEQIRNEHIPMLNAEIESREWAMAGMAEKLQRQANEMVQLQKSCAAAEKRLRISKAQVKMWWGVAKERGERFYDFEN